MKINKVSSSQSEKDLFSILKRANLVDIEKIDKNIEKTASLGFLVKLLKYTTVLTGIGTLAYQGSRYFYGSEGAPDFSKIFSTDEEAKRFFINSSKEINKIAKENRGVIEGLFDSIKNSGNILKRKIKTEDLDVSEEDKGYLEEDAKKSIEKGLDDIYERYSIDASFESKNITKEAKVVGESAALNYFCGDEEEALVHNRLADYIAAHTEAKEALSWFNFLPSLGDLTFGLMKNITDGKLDKALSDGAKDIGKQMLDIETKIQDAKNKQKAAIEAYKDLADSLIIHVTFSKTLMRYAKENHNIIKALCEHKDEEIAKAHKKEAVDFIELLDALKEFIERLKIILKPFSDRKAETEKQMAGQAEYDSNPFVNNKKYDQHAQGKEYSVYMPHMERENLGIIDDGDPKFLEGLSIGIGQNKVFDVPTLKIKFPMHPSNPNIPVHDETTKKIIYQELFEKDILVPQRSYPVGNVPFLRIFRGDYKDNEEQKALFYYFSKFGFVTRIDFIRKYLKDYIEKSLMQNSLSNDDKKRITKEYRDEGRVYNFGLSVNSYTNCIRGIHQISVLAELIDKEFSGNFRAKIMNNAEYAFGLYLEEYISNWFIPNNNRVAKHTEKLIVEYDKWEKGYFRNAKNKNNLEKKSQSINNKELVMKNANYSDQYYADAVSGLNNSDPLLKEFYSTMKQETLRRSELRDDRENLKALEESQDTTSMAHPKSIILSDGHGDGGLVENGHEQKEKSLEVAKRNPTGNFVGRYAWVRDQLKK